MNRFQVRPATEKDLPQLQALWEVENLPGAVLEQRLTELLVVDDGAGQLLAAIGLRVLETHGRLHSEAITFQEQAEAMRTLLWPRLESTARQRGLARLWTSLDAPFWKGVGFKKVTPEVRSLLPPDFADDSAAWLTLPLRPTDTDPANLEKQFAVFKAMSQAENERLLDRAKVMKTIALGLMTAVFVGFIVWVIYFLRLQGRRKK
jgi:N-acetylglutamate synthase-like GNAT family acetyltransferase